MLSKNIKRLIKTGFLQPDDQPCTGEVGLLPQHLGATDRLLNANHDEVYFKGMPMYKDTVSSKTDVQS